MEAPMSDEKLMQYRTDLMSATGDFTHLDVAHLVNEVDRLRAIVRQARLVAERRVVDDAVAARLVAILSGQPDPRK